jgi:hypothetical protein
VSAGKFPGGVTEDTELLAEKHNFFAGLEPGRGKVLQKAGELRECVKDSGKKVLNECSEKPNTTSAGDQDEF